jgi:hypothetical protein
LMPLISPASHLRVASHRIAVTGALLHHSLFVHLRVLIHLVAQPCRQPSVFPSSLLDSRQTRPQARTVTQIHRHWSACILCAPNTQLAIAVGAPALDFARSHEEACVLEPQGKGLCSDTWRFVVSGTLDIGGFAREYLLDRLLYTRSNISRQGSASVLFIRKRIWELQVRNLAMMSYSCLTQMPRPVVI